MASIKPILYQSKKFSDNRCPLAVRLIKDRKVKYFFIGHAISEDLSKYKENPDRGASRTIGCSSSRRIYPSI